MSMISKVAMKLLSKGWDEAEQVKDFGYVIPLVMYARKKVGKDWHYASLVFDHQENFLEAVLEVYAGREKNTRDKGCRPVLTTIVRDLSLLA